MTGTVMMVVVTFLAVVWSIYYRWECSNMKSYVDHLQTELNYYKATNVVLNNTIDLMNHLKLSEEREVRT